VCSSGSGSSLGALFLAISSRSYNDIGALSNNDRQSARDTSLSGKTVRRYRREHVVDLRHWHGDRLRVRVPQKLLSVPPGTLRR
jgi:hypothetical protein